jgi:glycosyltransferase involved in cell wall biosynthesis
MKEISVIIPTFNRVSLIERCLDALAGQSAPAESYEVIVVDDGSTDKTAEFLAGYQPAFSLRVERQANAGQSAARNRAIALAEGRFCLFLDDDIMADPQLVEAHLHAQRSHGGAIGIGMLGIRLPADAGGLANHFAAWWRSHYERLNNGTLQPDFRACYGGNLSAPLDVVRRIGGFDEGLRRSNDVEFAYRLEQAGLVARFIP